MSSSSLDGAIQAIPHAELAWRSRTGTFAIADSLDVVRALPSGSIDLVVTSPPFEGIKPEAADVSPSAFALWMGRYFEEFSRILKPKASVVVELGFSWSVAKPERLVHNLALVTEACLGGPWHLAQELYFFNPQLLEPTPSWDTCSGDRLTEAVTLVWWLSRDPGGVETDIATADAVAPGRKGNLLTFGDDELDRAFLQAPGPRADEADRQRFPVAFPSFFIALLSPPGGFVLDPFAGTCTTGVAAERLGRHWLCVERNHDVARAALTRLDVSL